MRSRALLVGLLVCGLAACGPKSAPPPKVPPPPPPAQLGEACKSEGAGAQANCAGGLMCMTAGGGSFCASACPCAAGGVCAASPDAPEMCMKACTSDGDCKSGLTCNADWGACAPEGLLAAKAPACSATALTRKAFGKVTQLSRAGKATHSPAAVMDRNGDLVSVYVSGSGPGTSTLASAKTAFSRDDLAVMEADKPLAGERENAGDPWITRDAAGKLYLAFLGWNGYGQKNQMIGLTTSDDGVNWSKPVMAYDAATDCPGEAAGCLDKPVVVIGPARDSQKPAEVIYVFYWSHASNSLRAVHSTDGGQTFSTSAKVGDGAYADADVTSSGKVHVVFTAAAGNKMGDTTNGVYYTSSSDSGETFAAPVRISSQNEPVPYHFSSPRVVVDVPRGRLYAVYTAGTPDAKWEIVLSTSKDGGVTWTRESVNDDAPCAAHMLPAAALEPATGKVHIVWVENRSASGGGVAYAVCDKAGTSCSKNEAVSEAPFAAFGFGRGSTAGLGDTITLVVDTRHKLLHALWSQPVDEGGAATARVFHSAAKLR